MSARSLPRLRTLHRLTACLLMAWPLAGWSAAPAEASPADYLIGLATYAKPDHRRDADYGAGGHLRYGYPLSQRWALESGVFAIDIKRASDQDLDDFYYGLGADALYVLRENGLQKNQLTPFVLGGGGLFHDDVKTERDTGAYLNVGLGLLSPLGHERLRLRLEGRYVLVLGDHAPAATDASINGSRFDELQLNLGLQFALGDVTVIEQIIAETLVDLDQDGVEDRQDQCPGTPAGVPVDIHGCARDSDGDGVADYQDECPNTPAGTIVDARGCARDDDRDGVINGRDLCPNTPTGDDVDSDGCTRLQACDNDCDQDGVPNPDDYCPGTLRGLKVNARGCVEEVQTLVLEGVRFGFDEAWLETSSFPILDRAVETLRGQPGMQILIAGHTDSMGSDDYNLALSRGRAASVERYLVEQGIAPQRLRSQGFGESRPIASNNTEEGRRQNRRVEFQVLRLGPGEVQPELIP